MSIGKKGKQASLGEEAVRSLPVVEPHAAGIDIGSRHMHVCAPVGEGKREVRMYATTTDQILLCAHWLRENQVKTVAMESTGVYWIPVLEILEQCGLATLLVDTRPLSRVPGRKTDVNDCRWIQTLHSHGLLQGSYRPSEEIQQIRSLVRAKATLVAGQSDWIRRMQKSLNQMNVRVHQAVSDLTGTTGLAMVRAMVAGERDPQKLAEFRDPHCRKSVEEITRLLTGHWRADHLFNLKKSLKMYDAHEEMIGEYEQEIQELMRQMTPAERRDLSPPPLPNRERMKAFKRRKQEGRRETLFQMVGVDLTAIDGLGVETVETVVSEYGLDLHEFASEKQFVAHLQLAPRRPVSGGKPLKKKKRQKRTSRAGQALQTAAVNMGRSATALGAYYRQIARRKGPDVAVFATARKLGTLIYRLLRWGEPYVDIGQQAYQKLYENSRLKALARNANQLGYELTKKEAVTA